MCIIEFWFIHSLSQLNSSDRIYIVQLDSLDGLTSSRLEVVPSYHDEALVLMFTLPRGRIWNSTFIPFCEFSFELSKYCIILFMMQYHLIHNMYIHLHVNQHLALFIPYRLNGIVQ